MREMRVRSRACAGSPATGVEGLDMTVTCVYALIKIKKTPRDLANDTVKRDVTCKN
jgi:hypothetical protein